MTAPSKVRHNQDENRHASPTCALVNTRQWAQDGVFWLYACAGTVIASALVGGFSCAVLPEASWYSVLVRWEYGLFVAGIASITVHLHLAILVWALWLRRIRVGFAAIGGGVAGFIATASVFAESHAQGMDLLLSVAGGLFGGGGAVILSYRYHRGTSHALDEMRLTRERTCRGNVRQIAVHLAVLVVVISQWALVLIGIGDRIDAENRTYVVIPQSQCPETLVAFFKESRELAAPEDVKVYYCAYRAVYICQITSSPRLLSAMNKRWHLSRVEENHRMIRVFLEHMPSDLQSWGQGAGIECFVSADWVTGDSPHSITVMNDKASGRALIRYYYAD